MKQLTNGLRVRVITDKLVHFRRLGTIMQLAETEGYYVHLDDEDRPDAVVFFHAEEIEAAPHLLARLPRRARMEDMLA